MPLLGRPLVMVEHPAFDRGHKQINKKAIGIRFRVVKLYLLPGYLFHYLLNLVQRDCAMSDADGTLHAINPWGKVLKGALSLDGSFRIQPQA